MAVIASLFAVTACAPYEAPEPTSVYQWQRQQDEIQRRACADMDKSSPRYARDCAGVSH